MSESFKEEVKTAKQQYIASANEQIKQRQIEQQKAQEKAVGQIKDIINSGKVVNYELSDAEKKQMEAALFKPTEIYEYTDQNGNKHKTKVTKWDLLQHKLSQSPEMQLAVFKFMMDGFQMTQEEADIRNKINEEINAALAGRSSTSKRSKSKKNKPPKDAVVLGSQYLGDLNL